MNAIKEVAEPVIGTVKSLAQTAIEAKDRADESTEVIGLFGLLKLLKILKHKNYYVLQMHFYKFQLSVKAKNSLFDE